jgi:hypothetical protein
VTAQNPVPKGRLNELHSFLEFKNVGFGSHHR